MATVCAKSVRTCSEPDETQTITVEQLATITRTQTHSITPGWYESLTSTDKVPAEFLNIIYTHFLGNRKCKKIKSKSGRHGSGSDNTLSSLAQCPWRYIQNEDLNRKPKHILEVECICPSPLKSRKKSGLTCQSVIEYVSVYRRVDCHNGIYEYKRVWEPRAVACVASTLPEPKRLYAIDYKMAL